MKTLSKTFGLFMFGLVLTACESDNPDPLGLPTEPQTSFAATVSWSSSGNSIGSSWATPFVQRQFRGSGTADLLSDVTMESAHTEIYRSYDSFDIENGQITLTGESEEQIYAVYSGSGSRTYGHEELNLKCTVQGGTGRFSNATGYLTIEVSRINQAALSPNMSAFIYGIIYLNQE